MIIFLKRRKVFDIPTGHVLIIQISFPLGSEDRWYGGYELKNLKIFVKEFMLNVFKEVKCLIKNICLCFYQKLKQSLSVQLKTSSIFA